MKETQTIEQQKPQVTRRRTRRPRINQEKLQKDLQSIEFLAEEGRNLTEIGESFGMSASELEAFLKTHNYRLTPVAWRLDYSGKIPYIPKTMETTLHKGQLQMSLEQGEDTKAPYTVQPEHGVLRGATKEHSGRELTTA